jgi:hypothetical protein
MSHPFQSVQNFSGSGSVHLAEFVLQEQTLPPGMAAEVEDVREDALLPGAGRESVAQRVKRRQGEAGQEDRCAAPAYAIGQNVPLLAQVKRCRIMVR